MLRKSLLIAVVLLLALVAALPAAADGPNFGEAIYADGVAWGTKGLNSLPAPNGHNDQSFDKLFKFTNGAPGQLAVSEAGPGNPAYNGGRWSEQFVTWTIANPPLVKSYQEIHNHFLNGHLTIRASGNYFLCPLLPVKQ